jgi:hypothetical protein
MRDDEDREREERERDGESTHASTLGAAFEEAVAASLELR